MHVTPTYQPVRTQLAHSFRNVLLAIAAVVFLCTSSASAQLAGKGQIVGLVTDSTGAVVPGATVVATSTTRGTKVTTTSTSAGDYTIPALDADMYTVTVTGKGFKTTTQQNINVNALETATVNVALTLGGSDESITISAAPPQLETTNATLGATMEAEMYSSLPIEMNAYGNPDQRRATDFAFLMPGVQGNNTSGNPTTNTGIVNGSGSKGAVSDVYVDGVAFVRAGGNGDPRYVWTAISVDAVDQFQVQTSGYSAIYEGQGIQNYTIKQGGAKYHGSVYEFFRNTALDTWGFFGTAPNPVTGLVKKPTENSNEYGINLSGPLVPFGRFKDKIFFFGNYNGYRYASETPTAMTFPTLAETQGDFSATGVPIYDPSTQAACTANSTNGPCRYQYGYGFSGTKGPAGGPGTAPIAAVNVIPSSEFSSVAVNMQKYLPVVPNSAGLLNNYIAPNKTGLVNWSTTDRIDYNITSKDTLTMVGAIGRQASSNPVGQTTAGRNVGPVPYNYGQTYAPKTAVGVIEETHIFTPHLVNQIKYGYARYNGPTFDADQLPQYAATSFGLTGLPAGAASNAFPITTFAGTDAPTNWGGTGPGVTIAENYTLVDNVQWVKGAHTITVGAQIAWLLYNVNNATGGTTPLTLATAVTETAGIKASSNTSPGYAASASTGLSYASFLVGQIDKASYTQYLQQIFGARFRPISPYVQDNWKIGNKLTLDLGLRYDFFPSITEVHNSESFFNPNLPGLVPGANGALQFTGNGANTCNCSTPVNNYMKNFGPRVGLAYAIDPKTVIRASYGVMFTHGGAVGGSASSLGTLGFSSALSASASGALLSTAPLTGTSGAVPVANPASGTASGPSFGTGYTTTAGFTGTPSSMNYDDPYLGGRAPEFINYTFGFQHQWTSSIATTISYVGSQGHFLPTDGSNPRGYYADTLDPEYALNLGSNLALTGAALQTYCAAHTTVCPSYYPSFFQGTPASGTTAAVAGQPLSQLLKPFPFQTVNDSFGYVGNSNYHSLQISANMRPQHGITFMGNYTWSRAIDDGGTFRTGYAIPAGEIVNNPNASYAADRIERTVSTTNQKHHMVITSVYNLPFGTTILNGNRFERAIFGGFKLSEIFQAYTGSPLAITGSACQTNPAVVTCEPTLNPNFTGPARQNGHWGQGVTSSNYSTVTNPGSYFITPSISQTLGGAITQTGPFINPVPPPCVIPSGQTVGTQQYTGNTCTSANVGTTLLNTATVPAYTIGNSPRTAPYNLYGPGNYQLDFALVRSFPLHLTEASKFNFRAEWYNVTNHTLFGVASTAVGNANFGQVTTNSAYNRKSIQLSGRIEF